MTLAAAALLLASAWQPPHVLDRADVIPPATEADLGRRLAEFETAHRIQIMVVTDDSLGGRPESAVALDNARAFGVGERTARRGVLVSFWKSDRVTRIDVTDSLSQLTGARTAEIVDRKMLPAFRQGMYAQGLEAGANEVMAFLAANPTAPRPARSTGKAAGGIGGIAIVVIAIVVRIALASAGFGGFGYRRGWGYRSGSSWGRSWGRSTSSWGGGSRSSGGGFTGRGASGRW